MNNRSTDQTAQMRRMICALLFAYGINRFSHDVAHIIYLHIANKENYNYPCDSHHMPSYSCEETTELQHDKTNKMTCAPSEDSDKSDQGLHCPSKVKVAWVPSYP